MNETLRHKEYTRPIVPDESPFFHCLMKGGWCGDLEELGARYSVECEHKWGHLALIVQKPHLDDWDRMAHGYWPSVLSQGAFCAGSTFGSTFGSKGLIKVMSSVRRASRLPSIG